MKELIRDLRIEIDGLAQLCEGLNPIVIYGVGVIPTKQLGDNCTLGNTCTEIGFTERKGISEEL